MKRIKNFLADESGAVTTDWLVLTVGVVTFGMMVLLNVGNGVSTAANGISNQLNEMHAATN